MRAFISTFVTAFKYLWRNPVTLAVFMAFPIVLIFTLGNALNSIFAVDTELDLEPVAVVADAGGALGLFLQSDEISQFITPVFVDERGARLMLEDGEACAIVIEQGADVSVLLPSYGGLSSGVALSVIESYRQINTAVFIAAINGRDTYALAGADTSVRDRPLGRRIPSAMDYYAVTMLVMILLYTGINGMDLFSKSLLGDTGSRIRLAPVGAPALVGGLLAASTLTSFLQGMVTFVFSAVAFGVNWGERIPLVLAALFAVVLFSQALCLFFTMLLRQQNAVAGVVQVIFWILTFISGGYIRIDFGAAAKVFAYAPNAMAHTVIFGAIYGGNEAKMALSLILLFAVGAALYVFAFIFGRRRLA